MHQTVKSARAKTCLPNRKSYIEAYSKIVAVYWLKIVMEFLIVTRTKLSEKNISISKHFNLAYLAVNNQRTRSKFWDWLLKTYNYKQCKNFITQIFYAFQQILYYNLTENQHFKDVIT